MEIIKDNKTNYGKIISVGSNLIADLMCQLINLIVELNREIKKLNATKIKIEEGKMDSDESGSPITVRAYKTSIIVLLFDTLESISNFLSELIILINEGVEGSPQVKYHLNQIEIDLLKEQKSYIDHKTCKIKISESNYIPTIDKLVIVPFLLGKIYGIDFKIDKSGNEWRGILELKQIRDKLTHPKFNLGMDELNDNLLLDINKIKPSVVISNIELFRGVESIRWYWKQIKNLFELSKLTNTTSVINSFFSLDLLLWLMMSNLNEYFDIKEFKKKYPAPSIPGALVAK